ncbi:MAG: hypothetical protein INR71_01120 [Terriglobus roseus]|nr:hypothetical protein [Terriglobus roseus]
MAKKSISRKAAFVPRAWDILRLMFLNNLMIVVGIILCVYKVMRYGRARPIPTRDMPVFA